jgi:hypothetical protein
MKDTFYNRLDFYRLLEAGNSDLEKIALALAMDVKILRRWQRRYDPGRGTFGTQGTPTPPLCQEGKREDILAVLRRSALEGNVPAAKLLLAEYSDPPVPEGEVLTVEKAAALIREWHERDHAIT